MEHCWIAFFLWVVFISTVYAATCSGGNEGSYIDRYDEKLLSFEYFNKYSQLSGSGKHDSGIDNESDNQCHWTIRPFDDSDYSTTTKIKQKQQQQPPNFENYKIQIYFEAIVLSGGWMHIYEESDDFTRTVYFWQTSVQNLPFPFETKSPVLHLVWNGLGDGTSSVSFKLTYYATGSILQKDDHVSSLNTTNLLPSKVVFRLHYPWAQIRSLDVNGKLPRRTIFFYHIKPDFYGSFDGPITLIFSEINLPNSRIIIHDGNSIDDPIIETLSGTKVLDRWVMTSGANAFLVVMNDIMETSYNKNNHSLLPGNFAFMYLADGDSYQCTSSQPFILSGLSGKFTDGTSSTKQARSLENCQWSVLMPSFEGTAKNELVLYFNRLDLKDSTNLFVFEKENENIENLVWACEGCASIAPPLLKTQTKGFNVYLSSDGSDGTDRTGFEAEYYVDKYGAKGPGDSTVHLLMSSAIVSPPGYGLISNDKITWYIQPRIRMNEQISIAIISFNLSHSCLTNVTFFDGPSTKSRSLGTFCGTTLPHKWIISTTSSMTVQLMSHTKTPKLIDFEFTYSANGDCKFSFLSKEIQK